jgi:IS30 family transposase
VAARSRSTRLSPRRWHFRCSSAIRTIHGDNHPWQRGTNENTNRLLRQYLHRNADLATLTQDELNTVAAKLNHRPRRVLGWATPAQAFGAAEPTPILLSPA